MTANPQIAAGLSLQTVGFAPSPLPGAKIIAHFGQPATFLACATSLVVGPEAGVDDPADGFLLLTVAPGQADAQKTAEEWVRRGRSSEPVIRQGIDGGWVLYRPGRTVLCAGSGGGRPDRGAGRRAVPRRPVAETRGGGRGRLGQRRGPHSAGARGRPQAAAGHQGADPGHADAPDAMRSDRASAAGADDCHERRRPQTRRQARDSLDIEDRLETLDGQIEVYEDLCELANQRQTDYSHFIREFVIEVMIVIRAAGGSGPGGRRPLEPLGIAYPLPSL